MDNPTGLVRRAAMEAVEAGKPAGVVFGTVISAAPLKINVEQKMTLGEKQLVLTRSVTDYKIMMTVDHETQTHTHSHVISDTYTGGGSASSQTHTHAYAGTKEFLVHGALKEGEMVVLIRIQGGQRFLVADRLGAAL